MIDYANYPERVNAQKRLAKIKHVLLVGSGKGGVGKSFISASLALALSDLGLRTGLLDLDIHGASIPNYLEIKSPLESTTEGLEPKKRGSLKIMSIALMTGDKPVPLRGEKIDSLVTQLFSMTNWGNLDYLVVDLPPGTGDEILSSFRLFDKKTKLLLVTSPSPNAIKIVSRLRTLAQVEKIRVGGVILNMAYLVYGAGKIYPFGRINQKRLERILRAPVLGAIPFDTSVNSSSLLSMLQKKDNKTRLAVYYIMKQIHTKV